MEVVEQRVLKEFGLAPHFGRTDVQNGHQNKHTNDQRDEDLKLVLVHEFHNALCRVSPCDGSDGTPDESGQQDILEVILYQVYTT